MSKERMSEIFNTGITTVSTYLLQGVIGLGISIITAILVPGFFAASGLLLPFGFGQGTGQALNYGNIYENDHGFVGGKSFGLSIAALGFLSASIGGVIYLNILKHKKLITINSGMTVSIQSEEIQGINEIPMQESMDKITVQFAFVTTTYLLTFLLMRLLGSLLPGMRSIIYGFNFLLGVLLATGIKALVNYLTDKAVSQQFPYDQDQQFLFRSHGRSRNCCNKAPRYTELLDRSYRHGRYRAFCYFCIQPLCCRCIVPQV